MNALERLRAVLCAPDGDVVIDGTDSDRSIVSEALKELEAALALSREVPEGLSEVTRQLIERDQRGRQKYGTTLDRADLSLSDWLQHMAEELMDAAGYALAAKRTAPAAAGAQGEEPQWVASLRAEVFNSAMKDVFSLSRDEVAHLLGGLLSCAPPAKLAPQPAAADGGVRERAVKLLSRAFMDAGMPFNAADCECGVVGPTYVPALRAIEAALSSHRQAGDESKFRELAERWRVMSDPYHGKCADELMALVEKGAGS